MRAYYNEHDAFAADWLRRLVAAGLIAPGDVDSRDIRDVRPSELAGYTQCHWFGGIGGWSLALRLAGWPDDRPVWTGSCPCQPFSAAGRGGGFADERHLWPHWHWLIEQCRPATIFGEQVASKDGLGWFDLVSADLEGSGYAVGAADLCAASVGAPHIRQRLWFVADAALEQRNWRRIRGASGWSEHSDGGAPSELANANGGHASAERQQRSGQYGLQPEGCQPRILEHTASEQMGLPGRAWIAGSASPWSAVEWLPCRDGKARPVEPGIEPLAHGVPGRVGRLRAYGNAIVPQVAAQFIGTADMIRRARAAGIPVKEVER